MGERALIYIFTLLKTFKEALYEFSIADNAMYPYSEVYLYLLDNDICMELAVNLLFFKLGQSYCQQFFLSNIYP